MAFLMRCLLFGGILGIRCVVICSLAFIVINSTSSESAPLRGGAQQIITNDPLATLIHNMCPSTGNCFAQISSAGSGTDGANGIGNDELSCFTNNGVAFTLFDGSTNSDNSYNGNLTFNGTFSGGSGPQNPYNPCYGTNNHGITLSNPTWLDASFSGQSCDAQDLRCSFWSGGHADGGDGTFAWFDVKTAVSTCITGTGFPNSTSGQGVCPTTARGHWILPTNLHSARYIPNTEPFPTTPHVNFLNNVSFFSATYTGPCTNNCQITFSGTGPFGQGAFLGAGNGAANSTVHLSNFVEVAEGQCGGNNSTCSSPTTIVCPVTWQPCVPDTGTFTETLAVSGSYFNVPNDSGRSMPMISHTYYANLMVPGTTKFVPGGAVPFAGNPANGANDPTFWVFDYGANNGAGDVLVIPTPTGNQPTWNSQGSSCYNPIDQNIYGQFGGTLRKGTAAAFVAGTSALTTTVATGFQWTGGTFYDPLYCMTDPVNGSGHEAIFQEDAGNTQDPAPNPDNGFTIATDVSGTPVVTHGTFGNTISSVLATGASVSFRTWIPSTDGTFMYVWEGGSKVYKLLTPSNLANWTISEIDGGTATGSLPQQQGIQFNQTGFDLGAPYCHSILLMTVGDVYVYKPPGCPL